MSENGEAGREERGRCAVEGKRNAKEDGKDGEEESRGPVYRIPPIEGHPYRGNWEVLYITKWTIFKMCR